MQFQLPVMTYKVKIDKDFFGDEGTLKLGPLLKEKKSIHESGYKINSH